MLAFVSNGELGLFAFGLFCEVSSIILASVKMTMIVEMIMKMVLVVRLDLSVVY